MKHLLFFIALSIVCSVTLIAEQPSKHVREIAWGGKGHQIINKTAVMHLPESMSFLKADSLFFYAHASDPDTRRNYSDTTFYSELWRHRFDIDSFPDFYHLSHNLDSLIMQYGYEQVKQIGLNPWTLKWFVDSLTAQLARGDTSYRQTANDIGHYLGDTHCPVHMTKNYNGQQTGNTGIHSRYESQMLDWYSPSVTEASVHYIPSPLDTIFEVVYYSYSFVDSIMAADNYAKSVSGWDGTGTAPKEYFDALWEKTQYFTQDQFQRASVMVANLWYTAWVNATSTVNIGLAGRSIKDIAIGNNAIFAVTADSGSVFRSTDSGERWDRIIQKNVINLSASPSGSIFSIENHGGYNTIPPEFWGSLLRSTDNGLSWDSLLLESTTSIVFTQDGKIFAGNLIPHCLGCYAPALFESTNDGASWTLIEDHAGGSIAVGGGYAVTYTYFPDYPWSFKFSIDDGEHWQENTRDWQSNMHLFLVSDQGTIYFGLNNSLSRSTDICSTYTKVSDITPVDCIVLPSGNILVATDGSGIFLFSENGDSLGTLNEGLTNLNVHTLALDSLGYMWVGTDSGVFKVSIPQVVGVRERPAPVPIGYALEQNSPNPFNPSTTIHFEIPKESHVTLKVYNMLGQEVATLVNGVKKAGSYEISFDGTKLSSGIYVYRIIAGSFCEARKMILMK